MIRLNTVFGEETDRLVASHDLVPDVLHLFVHIQRVLDVVTVLLLEEFLSYYLAYVGLQLMSINQINTLSFFVICSVVE